MAHISIFVGSVYGGAERLSEQVSDTLEQAGHQVSVFEQPTLDDIKNASHILIVTSTTGQGDIPPNLEFVFSDLKDDSPLLKDKPFAVAALGDSSYGESFCGAGKQFQALLVELQGTPAAELLEVDAMETLEPEKDVIDWVNSIKDKLIA